MAVKKKGLGRGLDALFPEKSVKPAEKKPEQKPVATNESLHQQEEGSLNASAVKSAAETKDIAQAAVVEEPKKSEMLVKISKVEPNRTQPRKQFDEDALLELSESIKQFGILQPLLVSDKGDYYEIIAGERRWRAAKLAGLKEVPVIIKEFNDQQVVEISLIENIQREDLNPIEELCQLSCIFLDFCSASSCLFPASALQTTRNPAQLQSCRKIRKKISPPVHFLALSRLVHTPNT